MIAAVTRREFLATGGALVLSFTLLPASAQQQEKGPDVPGSLKRSPRLDAWIRIDADGRITVFTGKAELGQGVVTALQQIAAEQLVVPFASVNMVTADTERTPNEGYTAGSNSLKDSGTAILNAAAQVRELLLAEAAKRLGADAGSLQVANGEIAAPGGRRVRYGELVAGQLLQVEAQPHSKFRDPATHQVIGKPIARRDIPAKVTGGVAYVHDLRLPGMVHARVVRPPSADAKLVSLPDTARIPGVLKIVRDGRFIAVVAEREYQAVRAMRALSDRARWEIPASLPRGDIHAYLQGLRDEPKVIDEAGARGQGGRVLEAAYRRPYQVHGSIGPSCAVALFQDGKLTIWSHTQGVFPLREAVAELVRMPKESVHCIHMEGSGCYGHNGADDVAADAALAARAMPGRPVRVQWMREDEHAWEPFGPAMVVKVRAAVDDAGRVSDWQFDVWSNTHSTRPGKAGDLAAGRLVAAPFTPPPPKPLPLPDGGGDRNAIPGYAFPNRRIMHHFIPEMPLRVSALRALGAYANVFAMESAMEELATLARVDPVEFRLRHLEDPRARDVVRAAAEDFGWSRFERARDRGRGFAFARYKNQAAYFAVAIEVEVDREAGDVHVGRVACAIDSGMAVNPDGMRNQVEGGVVQSVSWTLFEAVTWDAERITSRDWSRYPILRFPHAPKRIDVRVIDRPGQPFLGTGEASQGPAAAALANAVADALGARIRDIPIDRARIRAAATR